MTIDTDRLYTLGRAIDAVNAGRLARRLATHAERSNAAGDTRGDGYPTSVAWSPTPRGPGSDTTSVEAAALGRDLRDPVALAVADALAALERASAALNLAERCAERLDELTDPEADDRRPTCCELYCDSPSAPGHAGRCRPCYEWRRVRVAAGEDPGPVPAEIIDQRRRGRRRMPAEIGGTDAG